MISEDDDKKYNKMIAEYRQYLAMTSDELDLAYEKWHLPYEEIRFERERIELEGRKLAKEIARMRKEREEEREDNRQDYIERVRKIIPKVRNEMTIDEDDIGDKAVRIISCGVSIGGTYSHLDYAYLDFDASVELIDENAPKKYVIVFEIRNENKRGVLKSSRKFDFKNRTIAHIDMIKELHFDEGLYDPLYLNVFVYNQE